MHNLANVDAARTLPEPSLRNVGAAIALAVTLAVVLSPGLDMAVARMFYLGNREFVAEGVLIVQLLRSILLCVYVGVCITVFVGLVIARMSARAWLSVAFSQWLFFALCLGVGPGVVANLALKDQSGRARPSQIVELGGKKQFTAAFARSDQCVRNCSFVSGEASSMFVMFFAAACVWRPRWRALTAAGLAAGSLAGFIRMTQGAHFLTDVVFAGIFMAMTVAVIQFIFQSVAASPMPTDDHPPALKTGREVLRRAAKRALLFGCETYAVRSTGWSSEIQRLLARTRKPQQDQQHSG